VLFVERCPATILGVTGSKGKSTTTAMLGRMLQRKTRTWVGGNIGKSLLDDLDRIGKADLVVLELSSFMLHYLGKLHWSPHVAVVALIAPDHVAWHGSMDQYVDAKKMIAAYQRPDDFLVLNEESSGAMEFASLSKAHAIAYGVDNRRPFSLMIPGRHNQLNAQGAFAAAQLMGIEWDDGQAALIDFPGLPHRLQLVHEANGVRYFNDSIATIPEAAVAALDAFPPKSVIQIVGGSDKQLPLTALCAALCERAKAVLCIGQTGPAIAQLIGESQSAARAPVYQCGDLATAVKLAREIASAGDVVLLSPGCASYDQFANFEQRGEKFGELVLESDPR
jgi:UDP-N-acetylmuramoylalanine--D-glutamate ligase